MRKDKGFNFFDLNLFDKFVLFLKLRVFVSMDRDSKEMLKAAKGKRNLLRGWGLW